MTRKEFLCLDCGIDTGRIAEYYMVHDAIWLPLVGSKKGMLCIGCLELRLGRKLCAADFTDCYINRHRNRSQRLHDRINSK